MKSLHSLVAAALLAGAMLAGAMGCAGGAVGVSVGYPGYYYGAAPGPWVYGHPWHYGGHWAHVHPYP